MNTSFRRFLVLIVVALIAYAMTVPAFGQDSGEREGRDPALEQAIYDRLKVIDPQAVLLFEQATQDLDSNNMSKAKIGYEQVLVLAPDFPDVLRRLSYCELALGLYESGMGHAQKAYDLAPDGYNAIGLAQAYMHDGTPRDDGKVW